MIDFGAMNDNREQIFMSEDQGSISLSPGLYLISSEQGTHWLRVPKGENYSFKIGQLIEKVKEQ